MIIIYLLSGGIFSIHQQQWYTSKDYIVAILFWPLYIIGYLIMENVFVCLEIRKNI